MNDIAGQERTAALRAGGPVQDSPPIKMTAKVDQFEARERPAVSPDQRTMLGDVRTTHRRSPA